MLDKAKDKAKQLGARGGLRFNFFKQSPDLNLEDMRAARKYIAEYWKKLERFHPKDDETLIGMPKPYLVPSYAEGHEFDYNELYYWDSYFMIQGLLDEEHKELVCGILEDFVHVFQRFKLIPNGSRLYYVSRTQPPLLTSFIFDLYDTYRMTDEWLRKHIDVAKQEYELVWMGTRKPNARLVYQGLSRYYDFNYLHDLAEAESGWDMTPRFNRRALNYLPVDLNALLYKYETDFARAARILGEQEETHKWEKAARKRKEAMKKLMWDEGRGMYYDYNFVKERRGSVASLATYFPMWAGMVDAKQATDLHKALKRFEKQGGVATTDAYALSQRVPGALPMQWAYPNGWAPLHFIVVKALRRYGFEADAERIAIKWLSTNLKWFKDHGIFLEKYNVVEPDKPPAPGVYPSQTGFGWTNAVFEALARDYIDDKADE